MMRARAVQSASIERQPSRRLRQLSDGYRVATDALLAAAELGCSRDIYDALWRICEREADAYQASAGSTI